MSDAAAVCPRYHAAVELIGRRWAGAIISALLPGALRYNELRARVPDVSDRMLSERLKELESEAILVRTVIPESPIRVEYALTTKGRALEDAIKAIEKWASRYIADPDAPAKGSAKKEKGGAPSTKKRRRVA